MKIRIVHVDGRMPNLPLMLLSAYHKMLGDEVTFTQDLVMTDSGWPDRVYASAIFEDSRPKIDWLREIFGDILVAGGTYLGKEEHALVKMSDYVPDDFYHLDYSAYPDFDASIGFTQRGCRLRCDFCAVPWKEGRPYSASSVSQIWRGPGNPKHLHLFDNDFFGNPEWRTVVEDIVGGGFRVCINQGINIRVINDEVAAAIVRMQPYDTHFKKKRVYTAWDNIGQENAFFRGVDRLERAGMPPGRLMSYMLVGYDENETVENLEYRFWKMKNRKIDVYAMAHNRWRGTDRDHQWKTAKRFQRWVNRHLSGQCSFADYRAGVKGRS